MDPSAPSEPLAAVLRHWQDRPIFVLGDAMLDEWRYAESDRLCREAPAPVLNVRQRIDAAGGAANVAVNLARLGARPTLFAPLGRDQAAERLRACLAGPQVIDETVDAPGWATARKRRLVAAEQLVAREDVGGGRQRLPEATRRRLLDSLARAAHRTREPVLVLCDQGLGSLGGQERRWLAEHRQMFAFVAVDAHDLRPWLPLSPDLATPSLDEAVHALKRSIDPALPRAESAAECAHELARAGGADLVAVTLDRDGAVVTGPDGQVQRSHTEPVQASQAVGAGDAYLAAATLAAASGATPAAVAALAQQAAAISTAAVGTCVCDVTALRAAVSARAPAPAAVDKVTHASDLADIAGLRRSRGERVVFTNGCFDVLHRGHVACLQQARLLGDLLIVAVNSDEGVRRLKGDGRPVNPVEDRTAVLAALACVDLVTVFEQDSPSQLIEQVRPDVYVKGGDYPPELVPEGPLVRSLGGQVHTMAYVPDRSTSAIIDRIRARHPERAEGRRLADEPGQRR